MWRQLTAALLILAFTGSTFCKSVIVLDYYTNTAAFAKACINKAKLQMHCNGKCQMMKRLEQEEQKDQDNPERKSENKNEIFFANAFFNITLFQAAVAKQPLMPLVSKKPVDRSYTLLRPPGLA